MIIYMYIYIYKEMNNVIVVKKRGNHSKTIK